jgi:hypothetical protein
MGLASVALGNFNSGGNQFHMQNGKTLAHQAALIAGGSKVIHPTKTRISKAEEMENNRADIKRRLAKSSAKVTLPALPF